MQASIVDLRYKMHDVLKALDRNERVVIMFHGKEKGIIYPVEKKIAKKVEDHPFFGMYEDDRKSIDEIIQKLRGNRYGDF